MIINRTKSRTIQVLKLGFDSAQPNISIKFQLRNPNR